MRLTPEQEQILAAPAPKPELEKGKDGLTYWPAIYYVLRLNKVFGIFGWRLEPRGGFWKDDQTILREYRLVIPGAEPIEVVGSSTPEPGYSLHDAYEGVRTSALRRACKTLGMTPELWTPAANREFPAPAKVQVEVSQPDASKVSRVKGPLLAVFQDTVNPKLWGLKIGGMVIGTEDEALVEQAIPLAKESRHVSVTYERRANGTKRAIEMVEV